MFAENRPYRIRFRLPENQRGKVTAIRNINFDMDGVYVFEGMLPEYEAVRKFLERHGVEPIERPDTATRVERPVPQGIGKTKVAIINGGKDDLDDLSDLKARPDVSAPSSAPEGNRQSPARPVAGSGGTAGVRHGQGAGPAQAPAAGALSATADGVGAEAEVSDADFDF